MKGNNSFTLNESTMIEIVQQYLDREFVQDRAPKVTSVSFKNTNATFLVKVEERDEAPK